jgi:hypothetical protein
MGSNEYATKPRMTTIFFDPTNWLSRCNLALYSSIDIARAIPSFSEDDRGRFAAAGAAAAAADAVSFDTILLSSCAKEDIAVVRGDR